MQSAVREEKRDKSERKGSRRDRRDGDRRRNNRRDRNDRNSRDGKPSIPKAANKRIRAPKPAPAVEAEAPQVEEAPQTEE